MVITKKNKTNKNANPSPLLTSFSLLDSAPAPSMPAAAKTPTTCSAKALVFGLSVPWVAEGKKSGWDVLELH